MRTTGWQLAVAGALCAAALATPGRADWTAYGGDVEKHFFTSEKLQAPLGVLWKHATMTPADGPGNLGGPVVSNGIIYFPSKNRIYAVEADTGEMLWRAPEGDDNNPNLVQISATPLVSGDRVYVPDGKGGMTAYNAEDGNVIWTFRTAAAIRSSPILVDGRLYFGSDDDSVYCVDAKVGDLIWKSNQGGKDFKLPDDAVGSPVFYNGVIYINSADMKLWAFQAETGRFIWMQRMSAPSLGISPVAFNGRVYMAAGSTMYQFRLRGGNFQAFPLHQWVENDITTTPIITEHNWFFGDRNGYFHAFTTAGKPALTEEGTPWKVKLEGRPSGAPVMTPDTLFIATDKGFVYAVDILKGKITWTYRIEAPKGIPDLKAYYPVRAPLALSGGRLYVLGDDGTLTALAPDAPDDEGPIVAQPKPTRGAVVNGAPPLTIQAYVWDEGTGINPDTIEVLIDGQPIEPDEKPYNERVSASARAGPTIQSSASCLSRRLKAMRRRPRRRCSTGVTKSR